MSSHPDFCFAHAGLNVPDPEPVERWYVEHLNMKVARKVGNATFLSDPTGRVILEVYHNPSAPVLDFAATHFLTIHLAFIVDDPEAVAVRLLRAGATVAEDYKVTAAGDRMVMLRDPFGICVQLIRRKEPMF